MSTAGGSVRSTRQNTCRYQIPPLGRPIESLLTFDVFETLRTQNRVGRCPPTAEPRFWRGEEESSSEEELEVDLPDPRYVWENGRRIRLLGTLLHDRMAELAPLIDERQAIVAFRAADRAFPRDCTPKRPWTERELMRKDRYWPEDRMYTHTELSMSNSELPCTIEDWDGRNARPLIDRTRLVFGVAGGLVPGPDIEGFVQVLAEVFANAARLANDAEGDFASISAGVGYPAGAQEPTSIRPQRVRDVLALDYLRSHEAVGRLSAFGNALFGAFSPRSFAIADSRAEVLFANPSLNRLFPGVWTSWTFDLGPQTVTRPAVGYHQIRWCWIAITAIGNFDPEHGGHLILWDLGRILQFPPGTTVLLPPLLQYSIAQIQPGETRYSFTQYAAAAPTWSRWPAATHLFSKLRDLSSLRT